jgi:hypothetical protein
MIETRRHPAQRQRVCEPGPRAVRGIAGLQRRCASGGWHAQTRLNVSCDVKKVYPGNHGQTSLSVPPGEWASHTPSQKKIPRGDH